MLGDCTILCVAFLCGSVINVIILSHPPPSSSSHEPTSSSSTPPPTTCRAAPPHCQCHRRPHLTSSIPTDDEPLNPQTLTSERRHHCRRPCHHTPPPCSATVVALVAAGGTCPHCETLEKSELRQSGRALLYYLYLGQKESKPTLAPLWPNKIKYSPSNCPVSPAWIPSSQSRDYSKFQTTVPQCNTALQSKFIPSYHGCITH
jgi:hypothetical protein